MSGEGPVPVAPEQQQLPPQLQLQHQHPEPPQLNAVPAVAAHPHPHSYPHHPVPFPLEHGLDLMSAMKLTRGTSCVLCQQRKVRCDKNKPCANCVKARVECRVIPPQPPRRRKKRLQEKDLIERLRKYETLLAENGVKFEAIGPDLRVSSSGGIDRSESLDDVAELEEGFEGLKTSPGSSTSPSVDSGRARSAQADKPFKWFPFHKEFRASEELIRDSSEDEIDGSTIHHAFDKMYENQDGFPFIVGARNSPVTDYHPPAIQIFQLWQVYINNVNPLLRITHIPTVQGQIIEASARIEKTSKGVEALMFGIYLMAITSMEEDAVQKMFDEPKSAMLAKYHIALQQALINAGFMRSNDLTVLQAYMLYLIAIRQFIDPRQIFCLVGIAVRIAHRMGLHRDPESFGLSPFEVEQRRRLWWTLVGYDRRIGEMTGSTVTALSSGGDCKLPLNINDTDLHADGKESPTPHTGPTEMLFCLTRLTLAMAVASDSQRDTLKDDAEPPATPGSAKPVPMVRLANQENQSWTLDGFCAYVENMYLKHCDPKIPLHFFTLTMTRQMLCKMRVISFLVRLGNNDNPHPLNEAERETLFLEAVQMIEYDNVVQSAESLRGYKWYTYLHFPFPAYMFLVTQLRHRTTGPMVERAWDAITENHARRGLMNNLHSPMHIAFGGLFIKAWDARDAAERRAGREPETPNWIARLRQKAERFGKKGRAGSGSGNGHGRPGPSDLPPGYGKVPHPNDLSPVAASGLVPPSEENAMMMTPPVDVASQAPLPGGTSVHGEGSSSVPPSSAGGNGQGDFGDMDWSYIMQEYNMNGFGGSLGGFSGFGMPGMNGVSMGPPEGAGMFGGGH